MNWEWYKDRQSWFYIIATGSGDDFYLGVNKSTNGYRWEVVSIGIGYDPEILKEGITDSLSDAMIAAEQAAGNLAVEWGGQLT